MAYCTMIIKILNNILQYLSVQKMNSRCSKSEQRTTVGQIKNYQESGKFKNLRKIRELRKFKSGFLYRLPQSRESALNN
jgi:hypothetical protein